MKKQVLSLVAFMAFSVSAFANTNVENKKDESNLGSLLVEINCSQVQYNTYWTWKNAGASNDFADTKAKEAKASCEAENKRSKNPEIEAPK